MEQKNFLCGNSRHIYSRPPSEAGRGGEPDPPRFRTPLHLPPQAQHQAFRVLAQLPGSGTALVCLGATRQETLRQAWARRKDLPCRTVRLRLEGWNGSSLAGGWSPLPCSRRELPPVPRPRRPRRERRRQGA